MNQFSNIPDELLIEMCESWDTPTLVNMTIAYDRVDQLCSRILERKKEEYLFKQYKKRIDNLSNIILNTLNSGNRLTFTIIQDGISVKVNVYRVRNIVYVTQTLEGPENMDVESIPWILSGATRFNSLGINFRASETFNINDIPKLRVLAKNLIDQGYTD